MPVASDSSPVSGPASVFAAAQACLDAVEPAHKLALTQAAAQAYAEGRLDLRPSDPPLPIAEPGRPARPLLVPPRQLAQRGLGSEAGRAALLHAVAHIEFNAINLAWDAVYRFRGMPVDFYTDWIAVAADEARHFALLAARLADYGLAYGDLPAHDGLWEMARKTAHSCLERMALVPRVLEARGLDVTPGMILRLQAVGDTQSVAILEQILAEEVAHVAAGTRWFGWCCTQAGVDAASTFSALLQQYYRGALKGPFNRRDRLAAGFTPCELDQLDSLVA